jgi:hypothetical protein
MIFVSIEVVQAFVDLFATPTNAGDAKCRRDLETRNPLTLMRRQGLMLETRN